MPTAWLTSTKRVLGACVVVVVAVMALLGGVLFASQVIFYSFITLIFIA